MGRLKSFELDRTLIVIIPTIRTEVTVGLTVIRNELRKLTATRCRPLSDVTIAGPPR